MKEYIERAAALDVVKRTSGDYVAAWSEIAHIPAADVAEVRHGRWEYGKESKISFDCDGKSPLCECPHMMLTHQWDEYCSFGERKRISHEE